MDEEKNLTVVLPIHTAETPKLFVSYEIGSTEYNGFKVSIKSTGTSLILDLDRGGERIQQWIKMADLVEPWLVATLGEEEVG